MTTNQKDSLSELPPERATQARVLHAPLDDVRRLPLLFGLVLAGRDGGLGGRLVVPLLADDGQPDRLVDVPPHGARLVVVPDPELLVVVKLAPVRQLLGLDEDVAEELRAHCMDVSVAAVTSRGVVA